jgi:Tfp pilus assembly protein PilN
MKAVNLLPSDYRRTRSTGLTGVRGPGYAILGGLALILGLVTVYVVIGNSVSSQQSKLAALRQQVPQVQAMAAKLAPYAQFQALAQQRAQTVMQIASGRFDWAASMSDLAKVVPANTSLQSLSATSGTGTGTGPAVGGGSGIRGALPNPAFELRGCTASQDDVARLMSRLRLMNGVVRVTLSNASKQGSGAGSTPGAPSATAGGSGSSCAGTASSFDLVVFFTGPAGAAPSSASATSTAPATATPTGTPPSATPTGTPPSAATPARPPATQASTATGSHP